MENKSQAAVFLEDSQKILDECLSLISKKNHDYADEKNFFANFDFASEVSGVSPAQALLSIIGIKISRLSQLVGNGKEPMNESTRDTVKDLINYLLLLNGILKRNEK